MHIYRDIDRDRDRETERTIPIDTERQAAIHTYEAYRRDTCRESERDRETHT